MIKLGLRYLTALVLIVVALRQANQLRRNRHDLPLRALAPGLACVAIDSALNIHGSPLQKLGQHILGHAFPLVANFLWVTMAYCFATFFVLADPRMSRARGARFARVGFAVVVAALVVETLLPRMMPAAFGRGVGAGHLDYRSWALLSWDLLYSGIDLVFWTIGLILAVRYVRALDHSWLRWSVRVVCAGVFGMALVDVMAFVKDALRAGEDVHYPKHYPVTTAIYDTGLLGGQAALAVGLVLPVLASTVARLVAGYDRAAQTRYGGQIRPLWERLVAVFPAIMLPSAQPGERAGTPGFERLTTEITDGLAELAPFYLEAGLAPTVTNSGLREPEAAARVIRNALRLSTSGSDRAEPPFPRVEPDHQDWRRRARWMAQVSRELQELDSSTLEKAAGTQS